MGVVSLTGALSLSLSLTITLQPNAYVHASTHMYAHIHMYVYVCIMLTHSHMCHTVESPPNREIQRQREMERANVQERARAALLSAPQKLSHSTHTTFKYNSASSSNCRRGPQRQSRINYKKIRENHQLN